MQTQKSVLTNLVRFCRQNDCSGRGIELKIKSCIGLKSKENESGKRQTKQATNKRKGFWEQTKPTSVPVVPFYSTG